MSAVSRGVGLAPFPLAWGAYANSAADILSLKRPSPILTHQHESN
jgi:hypothetical protein